MFDRDLNAVIAVAGACAVVAGIGWYLISRRRPRYASRGSLLTAAEQRFFQSLIRAVPEGVHICPQVRLADLIDCYRDNRRSSFASIAHKHIDFVLIDTESAEILLAIELDDRSHERPARIARDVFVDQALESADVPILRVRASTKYDVQEIAHLIDGLIG